MENREELIQLLERYRRRECSADEVVRLLSYIRSSSDEDFRDIFISEEEREEIIAREDVSEAQVEKMDALFGRIEARRRTTPVKMLWKLLPVAATILVAVTIAFYIMRSQPTHTRYESITTGSGEVTQVTLPDGSTVWLNAASTIQYPEQFGDDQRSVTLTGEAFFNVVPDQGRPFSVQAGKLGVTVLGTSFSVKAYADEDHATVSMASGTVRATTDDGKAAEPLVLKAGDQGTLDKHSGTFSTARIDTAQVGAWRSRELVFQSEPLQSVFRTLERQYGVTIEAANRAQLSERVSLNLHDPTLTEVLDMLSYTINIRYEYTNDSTITIR